QMRFLGLKPIQWAGLLMLVGFCLSRTGSAEERPVVSKGEILNLGRCIELSLQHNPRLDSARRAIEASQARITQSVSGYLPQVALSAGYDRQHTEFSDRSSSSGTTSSTFRTGIDINQLIYDFGRTGGRIEAGRQNLNLNRHRFSDTLVSIMLEVENAYYDILRAKSVLTVAIDTVRQREEHLRLAQGFYRVGTRPKIDVTQAEVDLAGALLDRIRAENSVNTARATLNNAIGLISPPDYDVKADIEIETFNGSIEAFVNEALENRPQILTLKAQYDEQKALLESAIGEYYPVLNGNTGYDLAGDEYPSDKNWSFGASLTFPLFSGFAAKGKVAEARALLGRIEADRKTAEFGTRLDVEKAFFAVKEAEESIHTTQRRVEFATENLNLAEGRYKVGIGSAIESTDALVSYAQARVDNVQTLYNYKTAIARLYRTAGRMEISPAAGAPDGLSTAPRKRVPKMDEPS
ncbi:MAG: TolC family protein, partial [Pseudomonadota bacterium]